MKATSFDFSSLEQKLFDTATASTSSSVDAVWMKELVPDVVSKITDILDTLQGMGIYNEETFQQVMTTVQDQLEQVLQSSEQVLQSLQSSQSSEQVLQVLQQQHYLEQVPDGVMLGGSAFLSYFLISLILQQNLENEPPSKPYPLGQYDPITARAYFDTRLPQVLSRAIQLATKSSTFALSLLQDYLRYTHHTTLYLYSFITYSFGSFYFILFYCFFKFSN